MTQTIEQLTARVHELEEEVEFQRTAHRRAEEMMLEQGAQLAAAQEEIESNKAYFTTLLEEQRVLLAKAEQRVAEACALAYLEDYDLTDIAERVRAGEWRKFVKGEQ